MKRVKSILIALIMVLFITACSTGEKEESPAYTVDKNQNLSIKITGDYDLEITYNDIKDLLGNEFEATVKNPLYTANKKYVGVDLIKVLEAKGIKEFKTIYFMGEESNIRYTYNNVTENCYIVLFEDGKELAKPKFVKTTVSDMYYISNLNEIMVVNNEVGI